MGIDGYPCGRDRGIIKEVGLGSSQRMGRHMGCAFLVFLCGNDGFAVGIKGLATVETHKALA